MKFLESEIDSWEICKVFNVACVAFSDKDKAGNYGKDFLHGYWAWINENPESEQMKEDEYKRGYEMGRMFSMFLYQREVESYDETFILNTIKQNIGINREPHGD